MKRRSGSRLDGVVGERVKRSGEVERKELERERGYLGLGCRCGYTSSMGSSNDRRRLWMEG